jgi:Asp-tRNA(Asn)/Glu-tRNA(Gln) amidotransferase A subunit family amidase
VSTAFLSALEQARLIRERAVSPIEIVEEYLQRIERIDSVLNSYVTVCADEALAQAHDPPAGPFSGVPLPIKDLVDTAGIRTTYSCRAFAGHVPTEDSALVRCIDAAHATAALLEELGHEVEAVTIRWGQEDLGKLFTVVWQTIPTLHVSDLSQLEPLNAAFGARALATSSVDFLRAYSQLQRYGRRVAEFCAGYDVVLTPTLALPPVPVGWVLEPEDPWEQHARAIEFAPYTAPANVAGLPAVSIPCSWTEDGLPVGVQLVASAAGEAVLLRLSAQIEEARPWADRRPPLYSLVQA